MTFFREYASSPAAPYILSATLDGADFNKPFVQHPQIAGGGELTFEMTSAPKPRELHVEKSLASIDFKDFEPAMDVPNGDNLATCEYFRTDRKSLTPG